MQTCGYCGRENDDSARNCRECGTELAGRSDPRPSAKAGTEKPARINLEDIAGAFTTHDGFSRPSWLVILKALRRYRAPEERLDAWAGVVSQWASRWEAELGHDYGLTSSGSFFLVSALDDEAAGRLLQQANWMAEKIRNILGSLAWQDRPYLLIVQVADETLAARFDEAVTAPRDHGAERAARERSPSWTLICGAEEIVMVQDVRSALTWDCLSGLPLPRWLHGGFATQLERLFDSVGGKRPRQLFDADRVAEHHRFWDETTIQSFWAGTCETEHPDQSNLFYELSNILVQLLTEKTSSLVDYLRCANHGDAGQSAALVCLKTDLGELAGTFLGPGHWTPDALAIAECWDRVHEMNSGGE